MASHRALVNPCPLPRCALHVWQVTEGGGEEEEEDEGTKGNRFPAFAATARATMSAFTSGIDTNGFDHSVVLSLSNGKLLASRPYS